MGVFDVASPLFAWVDGLMAPWLPDVVRLVLWAVVAGVVSMALYRLTSNQAKLAAIKVPASQRRMPASETNGIPSEINGRLTAR